MPTRSKKISDDSTPITVSKKERPDDLGAILKDMVCSVNYKLLGLLFLIFLFVTSDVFMVRVLDNFSDALDYKSPTNRGIMIQGIFVIIFYVIADALIKHNVI
jgi:hypothetical protein